LVSFIDLGPTVLSLAGVKPPDYMHGRAFMGEHEAPPHEYLHGFRGRMDERYDTIRSVRDKRYVYLRNYTPHVPHGQHVRYMFQTPTTAAWKKLNDEGKLTPQQAYFWQPKATEELYDLQTDPDEVTNLANSPTHQDVLQRLRKAQQSLSLQIRDIGFLPEAEIHRRSQGSSPYEVAHDDRRYPLKRIMATAEQASSLTPETLAELKKAFQDTDSAVRYWAVMGVLMRGTSAVESAHAELLNALTDGSPSVRIVAAHALGQFGSDADLQRALPVLLDYAHYDRHGLYLSLQALNALDALGRKAASAVETIKALPRQPREHEKRHGYGIAPLVERIMANLQR
ncbi:MAG: sulfatase, partial [Planctomycetes bacterium]|nr:sulfatase [Planctomycetota bacterium]